MKKLMVAAAIVCAAAFAQAGTVVWGNEYGINQIDKPGDDGPFYTGTAYLIKGSAADFFLLAAADFDDAITKSTVIAYATIAADGALSNPSGTTFIDEDNRLNADGYSGMTKAFVTVQDAAGNIFISEELSADLPTGIGAENFIFAHESSYDGVKFAMDGGYQDTGWYTAVPEPTSGLLLLLGVAGLALRRRRA